MQLMCVQKSDTIATVDFGDESDGDDETSANSASSANKKRGDKIRPGSFFQPKRMRFFEERRIDLIESM